MLKITKLATERPQAESSNDKEASMRAVWAMLLVFLSQQILQAQMRVNPKWECRGAEALTADQMIARLSSGMDRQNHESAKCICAYVESLAIAGDKRAIPAIARYLDLPNPMTSAEVSAHLSEGKWSPLGGRYPAEEALAEYRQRARPVLVETIRSEATFTQKSENVLELFMLIGAVHPDQAIKVLVDAACEYERAGSGDANSCCHQSAGDAGMRACSTNV